MHPNVSIRSENDYYNPTGTGINSMAALAIHHYSSGSVPGNAEFVDIVNVMAEKPIELCNNAGKFTQPERGVLIEGGRIEFYNSVAVEVKAVGANIIGGIVSGAFDGCTGGFHIAGSTKFVNCRFGHLNLTKIKTGSKIEFVNSTVAELFTSGNTASVTVLADNSELKEIKLEHLDFQMTLQNGSQMPKGLWGWPIPKERIKIIG